MLEFRERLCGLSFVLKDHIFMKYILINAAVTTCWRVCGQRNVHNDTCTRLGQPRERKAITTGREMEADRSHDIPQSSALEIFPFSSLEPFLSLRRSLCAQVISISLL